MPKHNNSFDFLRLVFALLVIITHSVVLSGAGETDFLHRLTNGQINCSYLGVRGFFVISGFLIFKSLQRSSGVVDYLKKRFLRIFPALIVMLVVITFIIGPIFSSLSFADYYRNSGTWQYIASALRIPGLPKTASLPGLFTYNPLTNAVNGSLWTIWFELMFYGALMVAFFCRGNTGLLRWLLPGAWLSLYIFFIVGSSFLDRHIFPLTGMSASVAVDLGLFFLAGSALTLINWHSSKTRVCLILLAAAIIVTGLIISQFFYLRYIGLPLLVIALGHFQVPVFMKLRTLGEPSYGIYIYAYPIQQLIIQENVLSPLAVTCLAIPLALLAGYASWHLVEAPFLSFKRKS